MDGIKSFKILKTSKEYFRVYKKGDSFHSSSFVVFFARSSDKRMGFVASKKVGNAVCRNRCKRLLREVFYHSCEHFSNGTYVFVAKKKILEIGFHQANLEFKKTFQKINSKKVFS